MSVYLRVKVKSTIYVNPRLLVPGFPVQHRDRIIHHTRATHLPSRRWSSPPASSPLAGGISPSWSFAGEFCKLAAVTELHDAAILHLFRLGANYQRPMDLPDTTGLCWREGIYRCLGSYRSRVETSPRVSPLARPAHLRLRWSAQLFFVSAGPAQLFFAGPAQLVFVSAGSRAPPRAHAPERRR